MTLTGHMKIIDGMLHEMFVAGALAEEDYRAFRERLEKLQKWTNHLSTCCRSVDALCDEAGVDAGLPVADRVQRLVSEHCQIAAICDSLREGDIKGQAHERGRPLEDRVRELFLLKTPVPCRCPAPAPAADPDPRPAELAAVTIIITGQPCMARPYAASGSGGSNSRADAEAR